MVKVLRYSGTAVAQWLRLTLYNVSNFFCYLETLQINSGIAWRSLPWKFLSIRNSSVTITFDAIYSLILTASLYNPKIRNAFTSWCLSTQKSLSWSWHRLISCCYRKLLGEKRVLLGSLQGWLSYVFMILLLHLQKRREETDRGLSFHETITYNVSCIADLLPSLISTISFFWGGVQVIFICVYITNSLHFFTVFLSFKHLNFKNFKNNHFG